VWNDFRMMRKTTALMTLSVGVAILTPTLPSVADVPLRPLYHKSRILIVASQSA